MHFMLLLANWLPDNVMFFRLRGLLARPFLGTCGANLRLGRNITFYNPSNIHLGQDVYIAQGCWFMGGEEICIGDEAIFGPYCVVVSSNHTSLNGSFRYGTPKKMPISIGRGSWIASHVTITAGCEIGDSVLIAAGAVVKGKIHSSTMAGGIPARVIKKMNTTYHTPEKESEI